MTDCCLWCLKPVEPGTGFCSAACRESYRTAQMDWARHEAAILLAEPDLLDALGSCDG